MRARHTGLRLALTLMICAAASPVWHAGGPRLVDCRGIPMHWEDGVHPYNPDRGPLGRLDNLEARALVSEAFLIWTGPYFSDAMEMGTGNWTVELQTGSNPWYRTSERYNSPSTSWKVDDVGFVSASRLVMRTVEALPANAELRFRHFVNTQSDRDGGLLEYSIDDGQSWVDAGSKLSEGSYTDPLSSCCSNPLAGREAWHGTFSDWQDVVVDLSLLAGEDVIFRWVMGTDSSVSGEGWYIDDVRLSPASLELRFEEGPLLPEDVDHTNAVSFVAQEDSLTPIIFDDDGLITDLVGEDARFDVLGLSAIDTPIGDATVDFISEATIIINGAFYDGLGPGDDSPPDLPSTTALLGVMVHEVGHLLNLDHSLVNAELADDGNPANDFYVPAMYPFEIDDDEMLASLNPDDIATMLSIYDPVPTERIRGAVFVAGMPPDYVQGAQLTARKIDDPLWNAYSAYSGGRYFPFNPPFTNCSVVGNTVDRGAYTFDHIAAGDYTLRLEQADRVLTQLGTIMPEIPTLPGPEYFAGASSSSPETLDFPIQGFIDTDSPTEPNDAAPNHIALGGSPGAFGALGGTITDGDVDLWSIGLTIDDAIRIDIESKEIGYKGCAGDGGLCIDDDACGVSGPCEALDAVITLYGDPALQTVLATSDDTFDPDSGDFSLDPALELVMPYSAELFIEVRSYVSPQGETTTGPYYLAIDYVADADMDGYSDTNDNCPVDPNAGPPTPQLDSDGDGIGDACDTDDDDDGLSDDDEMILGTDPDNPDSDFDGALDGDEVAQGSNPLSPTALFSSEHLVSTAAVGAEHVTAGDLDNDGDLDLLSAGFGEGYFWYPNVDGRGTFGPRISIDGSASSAWRILPADVDRDGDLDAVTVSNRTGTDQLALYPNLGGAFGTAQPISSFANVHDLAVADLDGDGDQDIVVAVLTGLQLNWLRNDGAGWSLRSIPVTTNGQIAVRTADLDADGDQDILFGSVSSAVIGWVANDGAGNFVQQTAVEADIGFVRSLAVSDLDGDGDPDVIFADEATDRIRWCSNDLPTGFGVAQTVGTGFGDPEWVVAGDLDDDADPDVLVAFDGGNQIQFFENINQATVFSELHGFVSDDTTVTTPTSLALADLDADGDLDIASSSSGDATVAWYQNRTIHRSFKPGAENSLTATLVTPESIVHGDLNQDGLTDLVVGSRTWTGWFEGNGAGGFANGVLIESGTVPERLELEDMDADGDLDLVYASSAVNQVGYIRNRLDEAGVFDGFFGPAGFETTARDVDTGDLDGDGLPDLTWTASTVNTLAWSRNLGGGSWSSSTTIPINGVGPYAVASGDFDGDGDLDLALGSYDDGKLAWYENTDGSGTFGVERPVATIGIGVVDLDVADLDGDGNLDLLVASTVTNEIVWLTGDGAGNFASPGDHGLLTDSAGGVKRIETTDLDRDGDLDVVAALETDDRVTWFENLDGRGIFGSGQLIAGGVNGASAVIVADLDRDADTDVAFVAKNADTASWVANVGGSYRRDAFAPQTPLKDGRIELLVRVGVSHLGKAGDPRVAIFDEGLTLEFTQQYCSISHSPCTTTCARPGDVCQPEIALNPTVSQAVFDSFRIYVDTGSGDFEPEEDLLLAQRGAAEIFDGEVNFFQTLPADDPNLSIAAQERRVFWFAAEIDANASMAPFNSLDFKVELADLPVYNPERGSNAVLIEEQPFFPGLKTGFLRPVAVGDPPDLTLLAPFTTFDAPLSTWVILRSDKGLDPATIGQSTMWVEADGVKVSSHVEIMDPAAQTFVLRRSTDGVLRPDTTYRVVVTGDVLDQDDGLSAGPWSEVFDTTAIDSTQPIPVTHVGKPQQDNLSGARIAGQQPSEHTGTSIAVIEDLNTNGVAEILIGAPDAIAGRGEARLVLGGAEYQSDVSGTVTIHFYGETNGDHTGAVVVGVGDVGSVGGGKDGRGDFMISAPDANSGQGRVYLIFGTNYGSLGYNLASTSACVFSLCGLVFDGSDGDLAGFSISAAGDVNGDGADDLIIGAPSNDPLNQPGRAYLLPGPFGKDMVGGIDFATAGLNPGQAVLLTEVKSRFGGLEFVGESNGDRVGWAVSEWRQGNPLAGDEWDDLLIGAPGAVNEGLTGAGRLYAIWGSDLLNSQADMGVIDLDRIANDLPDEIPGVVFWGSDVGDEVGRSVIGNVDLNGDETPDIVVGANGSVYKINGKGPKRTKAKATKTGQSGVDATPLGGPADPPRAFPEFEATVIRAEDASLPLVVGRVGDVNGDGFEDLGVGSPHSDPGEIADAGLAYIIYGNPNPFLLAEYNLADVGATIPGLRLAGAAPGDALGTAIAGGMDVNGDGIDDVLFGAPFADDTMSPVDAGAVFVVSPVAPDEVTGLMLDKTSPTVAELMWDKPDRALVYAIYSGSLSVVRGSTAARTSDMVHTECALDATSYMDSGNPLLGEGLVYLISARNRIGEGPIGPADAIPSRVNDDQCP